MRGNVAMWWKVREDIVVVFFFQAAVLLCRIFCSLGGLSVYCGLDGSFCFLDFDLPRTRGSYIILMLLTTRHHADVDRADLGLRAACQIRLRRPSAHCAVPGRNCILQLPV